MAENFGEGDKALLTIEELVDQVGISTALVAKLIKEEVIVPMGDKTALEGMRFHESAVRIIQRWEERIRKGEGFKE